MPYKNIEDRRKQRREYGKFWRENNPEKMKAMREKYRIRKLKMYKENPEKFREQARKSYQNNKEKCIKDSAVRTIKRRERLRDFKKTLCCVMCGESDYRCLDFHHKNTNEKELTIGKATAYSWDRLMAEIKKCDVLCANCHRKVHNKGITP